MNLARELAQWELPARDAEPVKLREKAYASFTERLLARDFRPGQFLTQRELVDITGMTLGAIRELIPRLEADGLIKTVPQRGMQIAPVDLNLIRNAYQLRLFLEREAAAFFAENAPAALVNELRDAHQRILDEARKGVTDELTRRAASVDWNLHHTLIDFLDNPLIADTYRVNSLKICLIRQEQTKLLDMLVVSVMEEHLAVIEALATRDAHKAADAMGMHIASARNRAMRL